MHVSVSTIDELWTWIDQKVVVNTDIQTHSCGKSTGNACIGRSNFIMSNRITLVQRRFVVADSEPHEHCLVVARSLLRLTEYAGTRAKVLLYATRIL